MQGGELGTLYSRRIVVMLEDVLMLPPSKEARAVLLDRRPGKMDKLAAEWKTNDTMCTWIKWHGMRTSIAAEVWSFLPEWLYDRLIPRVYSVAGDYIVDSTRFETEHDAYINLRSSPDILTVYDSDRDRIELLWHVRGFCVLDGQAP